MVWFSIYVYCTKDTYTKVCVMVLTVNNVNIIKTSHFFYTKGWCHSLVARQVQNANKEDLCQKIKD